MRELSNTLRRAAIWSNGAVIRAEDLHDAVLPAAHDRTREVWQRALGNGFSLPDLLAEIARHYLARALAEARCRQDQGTRVSRLGELPDLHQLVGRKMVEPVMARILLVSNRRAPTGPGTGCDR